MCFALAHQILSLEEDEAIVENGKRIKLQLLPNCQVGDYILVQANLAVEKVSKKRAQNIKQAYEK